MTEIVASAAAAAAEFRNSSKNLPAPPLSRMRGENPGEAMTDTSAWIRALLAEHEGPLLRYAAGILGDVERARDVVQDTFLRLCQKAPEDIEGHAVQWLYTVCRHRALDVKKKESRIQTLGEKNPAETCSSPDPAPFEVVVRRETASKVLEFVGTLPAKALKK